MSQRTTAQPKSTEKSAKTATLTFCDPSAWNAAIDGMRPRIETPRPMTKIHGIHQVIRWRWTRS